MAYSSEIEKLERRWAENPKGRNFAPLADAYRKAGEVDKAIELCTNGLALHPDYVSAHIVYARCLIDLKNDPGAEEVFRKVLSLDPENIIALKVLGELAERSGRFDDQVEWLTRLLAADPMNEDARETLRGARTKAAAAKATTPLAPEPAAASDVVEIVHEELRLAVPEEPGLIDLESLPAAEAPTAAMSQPDFAGEPPLVEHDEVVLKSGGPRHSSIESFDDLSFGGTPGSAPAGLVPEEQEPVKPDAISIEGLARTHYEGSGMFRMDAPEEPPAADSAPSDELTPAADLPLIMPDDMPPMRRSSTSMRAPAEPEPEPPPPPPPPRRSRASVPAAVTLSDDDGAADAATLQAAEPVVTETMAELYLRQGHREDALRVYRALLADRPGDRALAAKVQALEPKPKGAKAPLESATAFLRRVWRGEPAPPPAAEPTGSLEAAFAGTARTAETTVETSTEHGAPTQPAEDVISLDAVFGDQVGQGSQPDLPAPAAPPAPEPARGATGGFSFDDFFGGSPGGGGAGGGGSAAPARPSRGSSRPSRPQPEDEDLDQFQAWLKGLKA